MKILLAVLFVVVLASTGNAQTNSPVNDQAGIDQALEMAQSLGDSLQLAEWDVRRIHTANIRLLKAKMDVWQNYTNRDSIRFHLQRIEDLRTEYYSEILPAEKLKKFKDDQIRYLKIKKHKEEKD
jgi:hypothetical protein